jgi:WD40 repeat protein
MIVYHRDKQTWEQFIAESLQKSNDSSTDLQANDFSNNSERSNQKKTKSQKKNILSQPYTVKRLSHGSSVLNPYFDPHQKTSNVNDNQKKQRLSMDAFTSKDALKRFIQTHYQDARISDIADLPELLFMIFIQGDERALRSDHIINMGAHFSMTMGLAVHRCFINTLANDDLMVQLNIPDFQQERRYYVEQACKHFINQLYEESYENLIQAQHYEKYDPFVLYTIGLIRLFVPGLIDIKKAMNLFTKSANYYLVESNTKKTAESFYYASSCAYILKKDTEAIQYANQALDILPDFDEAAYLLARLKAITKNPSCMDILKGLIEKNTIYGLKTHIDDEFLPFADNLYKLIVSLRNAAKSECDSIHLTMMADRHLEKYQQKNPEAFKQWKLLFNEANQIYQKNTYMDYLDALPILQKSDIHFQHCKHGSVSKTKATTSHLHQYQKQQQKMVSKNKGSSRKDTEIAEKEIFDLLNDTKALVHHNTDFQYLTRVTQAQASEKIAYLLDNPIACIDIASLSNDDISVHCIAFSVCGQLLASGAEDGTIRMWDLKTHQCIAVMDHHEKAVNCVRFSPNGQCIASSSWDQTIKLWDINTFEEIATLQGHEDSVEIIDFTMDSICLASGSNDQTVRLWDINNCQQFHSFDHFSDTIRSLCFSPDGLQLAAGSWDVIYLWDVSSKKLIHTFKGLTKNYISALAISPDGMTLAAGSHDRSIRLLDLNSKKQLLKLQGHTRRINCVAFSPDNLTLASGSHDRQVKLWNVKTGKEINGLDVHKDIVCSVQFSPDGMMLASGSHDGFIRLWQIHYKIMPKDALIEIIDRNKTDALRRRQAQWRSEMRCEICGERLGFLDILKGRHYCQKHEKENEKG